MNARLTTADNSLINRARALASARGVDAFRVATGQQDQDDNDMVYLGALGEAQFLLGELADLAERLAGSRLPFTIGQLVTVTDGGWTGTVERIDADLGTSYVRFPDRPDLVPYAFEALEDGQA